MAKEYIEREAVLAMKKPFPTSKDSVTLYQQYFISPSAVEKIPAADVVPVVRCKDCKYSAIDYENRKYCKLVTYYNHVPDDWFCADGERKDGDANVQNWEKNHLRPTNMSGAKCEPCKPTQPECGDCEYIKDGDEE